ncbi:MAG: efflux RND transporter periplasmic adaptor subunit [Deltaproteobacteria bacterium]|nr:efflux RND transporter periplasmic adaptor subunit [Deltaproteobacteria bacterium]
MTPKLVVKKYIFVIIPLIIVLLAGLVFLKEMLKPQFAMQRPPSKVTIIEAKISEVRNSYEIIGVLEADKSVDLVARVTGFLEEKSFNAGDKVKEGDVLFRIDPKAYQAAYDAAQGALLSAEAQLTQAQLNFNRTADLYAKRSSPKSDYDNAKAQLDVAQAAVLSARGNLAQAELNLDWANVKAPFDGEISDSPFSIGSYVGPTSGVLATLVAPDPIKVRFGVPDTQLADLRFGAATGSLPRGEISEVRAGVKVNGTHLYEEPGKITYVAPLVDAQTDTVRIKASFPNKNGKLVPGEVVTVVLEDGKAREAILVPKNCVMYTAAAGSFVYVLGEPKAAEGGAPGGAPPAAGQGGSAAPYVAEQRMVTRGIEFPEGIEILEGLKVGDKVINLGLMSGGALIQPGTPVELLEDAPQASPGAAQGAAPGGAGENAPGGAASGDRQPGVSQ